MNFTKFTLSLIIGLAFITLISNVHGEKLRKVPGREIQNADEEANIDPNAENRDEESRGKLRKVPGREIQNADEEANIDPNAENRNKESRPKLRPGREVQNADEEANIDPNAENHDEESRGKLRKVLGREILHADEEANIDPNAENHDEESRKKLRKVLGKEILHADEEANIDPNAENRNKESRPKLRPGRQVQNADEEANIDPNAENHDEESRGKLRKVPGREIQNADEEANIDPNAENRNKESRAKLRPGREVQNEDEEANIDPNADNHDEESRGKLRKVPGREIQNADEDANIDPNAENRNKESRAKLRPGREIQNAAEEANIDPNAENRDEGQCSKVKPIKVSEPIDDDLLVITIEDEEYEPVAGVRNPKSIDDEDGNRISEHLKELARLVRSSSMSSDSQSDHNRHQENTEELHRTLDEMLGGDTVFQDKAEETPKKETNNREPRIVGGEENDENEIKYQVVLHNGDKAVCGATIIADRYLLSAAQCFIDKQDDPYGEQIYVLIGTNKLSDDRTNVVKVKTVYVPIIFHHTGNESELLGDIAVLKLTRGLGLGKDPRIAKVDLPEPLFDDVYDTYDGEEGLIAGFGASALQLGPTKEYAYEYEIQAAAFPKNLVKARVDVLENSECDRIWSPVSMTRDRLCGRIKGFKHRGVCMGDTGNALVYENTAIGVISIRFDLCNEEYQHNGKPTIYTRVSRFTQFIQDAMADKTNQMRIFDMMDMED